MLLLMNLFFSTVYEKGISFRGKDEIYIRILVCNILCNNVTLCYGLFVSSLLVVLFFFPQFYPLTFILAIAKIFSCR